MAALAQVRFLIVDDNVHMLQLVKTILKGFGADKIFEAKNLAEAFNRLKNDQIDIVILDYVVGDDDGVEMAQKVRRSPESPAPFVPIIMLTAHAERKRVELARDAGVNEFCAKPVTPSELFRKVAAVIDRPRNFIKSDDYIGPDRRRAADPNYKGEERRSNPDT